MLKENSKITKAISVLYEANRKGIWLWVQDNGLKYKSPEHLDMSTLFTSIKEHKDEIMLLLKHNQIFNNVIRQDFIYRVPVKSSMLSFAQERLWFIEQYEEGTNAYHIPFLYEVSATANRQAIMYALQQIVKRHEVLRTVIGQDAQHSSAIQVIQDAPLQIEEQVISMDEMLPVIRTDINRPFDLRKEYPLRVKFYELYEKDKGSTKWLLLINMHHIASDGWSMEVFQKELSAYYKAGLRNDDYFSLPEPELQYKDYAIWQRNYLSGELLEKQLGYWKEKLSGFQPLELPTDEVRPVKIDYRGGQEEFSLSNECSEKLRAFAQEQGVTLYSVMLSSFAVLLSKYSGQEDLVIGSPIANRHHRQTENMIGFFVNTQANRIRLDAAQDFRELVQQVYRQQVETQLHQDLPFEKLVDELGVERDPSRHPIFQVMFGVQHFDAITAATDKTEQFISPAELDDHIQIAQFDLSFLMDDQPASFSGKVNYASGLFNRDTILRLIRHYKHLLDQLMKASHERYSKHALLLPEEEKSIVYEWNDSTGVYPRKSLVDICVASIAEEKERIAVIDKQGSYSYRQIGQDSYHIAAYLVEHGLAEKNQLIAVLSEKGVQQVISTLGIMRSGAAYLPLHIEWPANRINDVLEQGLVKTVLVTKAGFENIRNTFVGSRYNWLIIEEIAQHRPLLQPSELPEPGTDDIAYVIFTSGSTGKPKGVTISHHGAVNTLFAVNERFSINRNDTVLAVSELSFDLSVYDIFGVMAAGGVVVFPDQQLAKDPRHWYELIVRHQVTIWDTVPQLMQLLVDYVNDTRQTLNTLKVAMMSGDWIPVKLPDEIKKLHPKTIVMSLGGATEGSIWSIWYEIGKVDPEWKSIPYGRAMPNQKMYVLDKAGEHCPVGVTGNIYIGGDGVALGYWNDVEKTQARFIDHPGLGRLYHTGDLGKWNRYGNIEFCGRNDNQVKIRGYRIELEEIEHVLMHVQGIQQSYVAVKETKADHERIRYLVGYYVCSDDAGELSEEDIQNKLLQKLPEYMVPTAWVRMKEFPLTSNGKLDKNSLPDPEWMNLREEFVPPFTETEIAVSSLWQKLLGLERVGVTDDFFRIGGNSILAIQLSYQMEKIVGQEIKVADIFRYKTIQALLESSTKIQVGEENIKLVF